MSRVFVATETAFGRKVVVKVLKPELAEGVSVERFKREIAVAAKLQHPHIVPLLSAGQQDGVLYYTMPFVDGESLRQRLEREIELPVPDVVRMLREIAAALAYAHRHKLVHRDIKPENVLFSDGTAVVTDFGIAKALTAAKTHGDAHAGTITQLGTSIGTPAYMAPEQVAGDPNVDHRADLYALGCVAYELLAGRPPFTGRSTQALMAAHATERPEAISRLRPSTPPALAALVTQCLEKRAADRPQNADDVARALESMIITPAGSAAYSVTASALIPRDTRRVALGAVLLLLGVLIGTTVVWGATRRTTEDPVRRWSIALPDTAPMAFVGSALYGAGRRALEITPDGSVLVYVAQVGPTTMLYARRLDEFDWSAIPGTEGAFIPFASPDGKWIGFFAGRQLKKASIDRKSAVTLAEVQEPIDGAWLEDGRILVSEDPGIVLHSVPETGGRLTRLDGVEITGSTTESVLPGASVLASPARRLQVVNLRTGATRRFSMGGLVEREEQAAAPLLYGSGPRWSASGHVLYSPSVEEGGLMALPFDATKQRVLGPPALVLRGIRQETGQDATAQFALSNDGTLVYATGENAGRTLFGRRDRHGATDTLPLPRADYGEFRLSPDGRYLLTSQWPPAAPRQSQIVDLANGTRVSVSQDLRAGQALWWPDGKAVLLQGNMGDGSTFTARINATTGLVIDTLRKGGTVRAVSADSSRMLVTSDDKPDLWLEPRVPGNGKRVLVAPALAYFASFSPDGEWILYTAHIAGRSAVVVVRASNPSELHQLSPEGGEEAIWNRAGDEIVFRNSRRWYGVTVSTRGGFSAGPPRLLFEGAYPNVPGWSHELTPDGKHHVVLLATPRETTTQLNVVTNWFAELRRLAPPTQR